MRDSCNSDAQLIEEAERTLEKILDITNVYLSAKTTSEARQVLLRLRSRRLSRSLSTGVQ